LLDRIRQELHKPWPIAELAREARTSKRTFELRFFEATGTSPGEWLIGERVEAAKQILVGQWKKSPRPSGSAVLTRSVIIFAAALNLAQVTIAAECPAFESCGQVDLSPT
jgi:AraC-like DNA-binding protein